MSGRGHEGVRRRRTRVGAVATVVIAATMVAACTSPPVPAPAPGAPTHGTSTPDRAAVAYTILPPGNGGLDGPTLRDVDDQREMYDRLDDAVADGTLTDADLSRFYKSSKLDQPASPDDRVEDFTGWGQNVSIRWDAYSVPHVQGEQADDVAWGAGYATAEARFAVLEVLRRLGRSGLLEVTGGIDDIFNQLSEIGNTPHVAYSDDELNQQIDDAMAQADSPAEAQQMLSAIDSYVAGINAWMTRAISWPALLTQLGVTQPTPFTRADIVAAGIAINDIFGYGGGGETQNATALAALVDRFGASTGRAVFDDLRDRDDPDATTTATDSYPYPLFAGTAGPTSANVEDPAAIALPDPDRTKMVAGVGEPEPPHASNWMLLGADRTTAGHPIFIGGPQSAYFAPQLLFEMELQGGGYSASGINMPGIGPWIVIGHSTNYAWSATSGDGDQVDQRIEKLCEPTGGTPTEDSLGYLFNGNCLPMTKGDASDPLALWRTVHGPVVGTATVDGVPVAISNQLASRGHTADAAVSFWRLSRGQVTKAADFAPTMKHIPMSFNWAYVNQADIAYFYSGRYPIRAPGTSYDLPSWGTGEWEWRGVLDWTQQPQAIDPPQGYMASWNNKPAPGWSTSDNNWGTGGVQRVDLLVDRLKGLHGASAADLVHAHQDAASVDLRAADVVPAVLGVLATAAPPNARLGELRDRLAAYVASGSHRRDRDDDHVYDDPMVPFVANLWEPLVHAVFDRGLGSAYMSDTDDSPRQPGSLDNTPSLTGSAFSSPTWYSLVDRELARAIGSHPTPDGVPSMCGRGDLDTCRAALWDALGKADFLTTDQQLFHQSDVDSWRQWAEPERIRFIPFVVNTASMRWTNRPTFEQVMSFR